MARRLTITEEQQIVEHMRDNPGASIRTVARRFGRSRPTIADLRSRYALDRPAVADSVGESATSEVNQGSDWILKELAETDRETEAWFRSLPIEEQDQLAEKGRPSSAPGEPSFLDAPNGAFLEG